ncbi:DUF1697 domain-containing protein [Stenotrophomonas sp. NA06056]|uniref:DUF1697 domain-containing protein n=1 Tax=Stenotrophomonas sp. NA06056 TaxID=2742129 RepID=UPI001589BD16|nr:DUF1697 domain-containing protein [Stenotrophomonas sp. NA06056]QKW56707.1 DUF1697 domain-containing protein [Stenotrophomonas sp. NA06056]
MNAYVALLRAVNVGGTGKLPMAELVDMCQRAGFADVRTYIASGNAVFSSPLDEAGVRDRLARCLQAYAGKPVGVLVRTAAEMAAVVARNPFRDAAGNRVVALFMDEPLPRDPLQGVTGIGEEQLALGQRELFIHYGDGMADSRLRIPFAAQGTARNINTVTRLAAMAAELD